MTLPTVLTTAGLQPQDPTVLRTQLITAVAAATPGYTADLPGSLIEDISSTDVAALVVCDQARVELVNSLTPFGANAFILNQLGQIYGVQPGAATNTSVFVVFSGAPGYVVPQGFVVSDGTYQYIVQDGAIIGAGGTSPATFCVAALTGSWSVPIATVTQLATSIPTGVTLTVTNPAAGIPGTGAQTEESYRAAVLQAGLVGAQGMPTYLKTLLAAVPGVQSRLISMRQVSTQWEVICGGGDPYQVANAIFTGLFDISSLTGSVMSVSGITQANPGVVTTSLNHGLVTGQTGVQINGIVGMTALNGTGLTVTVLSPTTFGVGVNTSGFGAYVSGGVVTPNSRNISVTINDYPNTYLIPFVNPPQQVTTVTVTWNTTATNFVAAAAVAQLAQPAITSYINSIPAGFPINSFQLQEVFQQAVAPIVPTSLLTRLIFAFTVNGVSVSPTAGTGVISGDPESYFFATSSGVTINQG